MMVYHSLEEIKNTYSIIYADPPWKFGRTGKRKWKPASHYYQTLSPKQLSALPIGSLAKEDCILFMWVVSPELDKCIEVGKAWGLNTSQWGLFGINKGQMLVIILCHNVSSV